MKKRLTWVGSIILVIIVCVISFICLSMPVSKAKDEVVFKVNPGDNKLEIVSNLKKAGIIRSKYVGYIYVFLKPNVNLQAGDYKIDKNKWVSAIINQISKGDTNYLDTISLTFVEGKTISEYAEMISKNMNITSEEFITQINDRTFIKELIKKYWFLDNTILNERIYYPLEGYLYPDTYEFYTNATSKDIIYKLLDKEEKELEAYRKDIENSDNSLHELLSIAAIAETEATNSEDRAKISQVVYTRLDIGMSLGMDVTTYYGVRKNIGDGLTVDDLNDLNDYNTRNLNFAGLPIGPICNPSLESLKAALNPSKTDYLYFYANMKTGKVYFAKTYEDFLQIKQEIGQV